MTRGCACIYICARVGVDCEEIVWSHSDGSATGRREDGGAAWRLGSAGTDNEMVKRMWAIISFQQDNKVAASTIEKSV